MKYECSMCGFQTEASCSPSECPSCGMMNCFRINPFDSKCSNCGQGYFAEEKPNFCINCGARLFASELAVTVKKVSRASVTTPPASSSMGTSSSPSSAGMGVSGWFWIKVICCILLAGLAIWGGYYVIIWLWAVLCFIFRHWVLSTLVALAIIGGLAKSQG